MAVYQDEIQLETEGHTDVLDITEDVHSCVERSEVEKGIICVWNPGSTGSLTTVEYESGCISDLQEMFERIAPEDQYYKHEEKWQDGNGHSHMRASLLGPSISIPIRNGTAVHGTWQQVIFVDFDNKPRDRELLVQIVGE